MLLKEGIFNVQAGMVGADAGFGDTAIASNELISDPIS